MSDDRSKSGPSRMALLTALYRAIGSREFGGHECGADRLAACFLPAHARWLIQGSGVRAKIRARDHSRRPGVFEYVLARTVFFDRVFLAALEEHVPWIVIMGAGYDTRAYRYARFNSSSRVIELDARAPR